MTEPNIDSPPQTESPVPPRGQVPLIFVTVVVIAVCGLIYELLASTIASYLLGDSVTQFSTVIGTYLSAMGIGAWLSRFFDRSLARRFVDVELAVALVGGFSAPLLYFAFGRFDAFRLLLYSLVVVIGVLVPNKGLTLPFVSYGGTSLIMTMFLAGLVLNIGRRPEYASAPRAVVNHAKRKRQRVRVAIA